MRRRLIIAVVAAALLAGAAVVVATRDGGDGVPAVAVGLDARTISAGAVDIAIEPRQLDDRGALFALTLDTHAVELASDIAAGARLEVAGTPWPVVAWQGDGPGGHHREGTLRFASAGEAAGTVRLTLAGYSEPVEAMWELPS